jgi:hypothetical protein
MKTVDEIIIDALGGTRAVARMIEAPSSTVHSWRSSGIPRTHRAHISLRARVDGKAKSIDWQSGRLVACDGDAADHAGSDMSDITARSSGILAEVSAPAGGGA